MSEIVKFTVYGEPVAKGRPRFRSFNVNGKNVTSTYTPKATENYENLVKLSWQQEGAKRIDGAVLAIIKAYFTIPKSVSQKKRACMESLEVRPEKKPDTDNIAKIVLDSINGRAYLDDKSVVDVVVSKYYSSEPRVEVMLVPLTQELTQRVLDFFNELA